MRALRHPMLGLAVIAALAAWLTGGSPLWAVVGLVAGALAGLLSLQVGMLAGALAFEVRVHQVVVGVGRRLTEWTTPHRTVVLRAAPLLLSVAIGPGKAPARRRMWSAALCSAGLGVLVVAGSVALVVVEWGVGFWLGWTVGAVYAVVVGLVPRRTAVATSTGWYVWRLPGLTGPKAEQLDAAPVVGEVVRAAQAGDLAVAAELAEGLARDHPGLRTALAARILVLEAHGRYAEALTLALPMAGDDTQTPAEAAVSFAALAGLACATVEAGVLPAEVGLGTAVSAMDNAEALGYPKYKLTGVRALHALLTGETTTAVALARTAVGSGDDPLGRADDLATLASAHMAAGDNATARAVLAEAEALVPWWPRVAAVRDRLSIA
ncbi:hypothetical protein ACOBQX_11280 [Actinokineospora sp. G85]|uniref:hypothetical protein n=1 Tax=Actinokineospora sp. G85 TaxID=3406626 RepID=UPI003C737B9E